MKNKTTLFTIVLVFSGMSFGLLFSPARVGLLVIFALACGFLGWLLSALTPQKPQKSHKALIWGGAAAALILLWLASADFEIKWSFTSAVASVAEMFHLSQHMFLQLGRGALVLVSLPAVTVLFWLWLPWLCSHVHCLHRQKTVRMALAAVFSNHFFKRLGKASTCVLGSVVCGILLLALVYLLPVERMDRNLAASAPALEKEDIYYTLYPWCTSTLDNSTDSLMLLEAACDSPDSLMYQIMMVENGYTDTAEDPYGFLIQHYVDGQDFVGYGGYARYWHGYLVLLKPLLLVMDYNGIRALNLVVQLLLTVWICILLKKKKSLGHALAYFTVYLLMMPVALGKSLQYSTCYYVLTGAVLILLNRKNTMDDNHTAVIFLFAGIATAYIDFLTYPIATFGIPAVVWLALHPDRTAEQKIAVGVRLFVAWCMGYVCMWASKWIIASLCLGDNVILDAMQQVAYRSGDVSSSGSKISVLSCLCTTFSRFFGTPATLLMLGLAAAFLWWTAHGGLAPNFSETAYCSLIPYSVVGLFPILWFVCTLNHSDIHAFFTNKSLSVMALAVLFALADVMCLRRQTTNARI